MNRTGLISGNRQHGATLVVALLLLMVLTMVAITSMESSNLSFKMSTNMIHHEEAFNNSESARIVVRDVIPEYIDLADWDAVTLPTGLTIPSNAGLILADNGAAENVLDSTTLQRDFVYSNASMEGDIYVLKGQTVQNTFGAGSAQYKGYSGAGVGIGGQGGAFKYFELRSRGTGSGSAESWTATDYRYVF